MLLFESQITTILLFLQIKTYACICVRVSLIAIISLNQFEPCRVLLRHSIWINNKKKVFEWVSLYYLYVCICFVFSMILCSCHRNFYERHYDTAIFIYLNFLLMLRLLVGAFMASPVTSVNKLCGCSACFTRSFFLS